jgi:hypothetical protein
LKKFSICNYKVTWLLKSEKKIMKIVIQKLHVQIIV